MKSFFRILIAPLTWLIKAISPLGEPVAIDTSNNFYYNKSKTDIIYSRMGNWFELGKQLLNADASSFKVLNSHLGKDKSKAYYQSYAIPSSLIDLNSFHASSADWMGQIGCDKDHVYLFDKEVIDGKYQLVGRAIDKADPDTYRAINLYWAKDEKHVFYNHEICQLEARSFELINNYFVKDIDHTCLYTYNTLEMIDADASSFQKVDKVYARDAANLYLYLDYYVDKQVHEVRAIPYANFESVQVLENMHVIVKDKVYYKGHEILGVNARYVEVVRASSTDEYIKDDRHVYFRGKVVEKADVETFYYDKKTYTYRDKNFRFAAGEIWKKANNKAAASDDKITSEASSFDVIISTEKENVTFGDGVVIRMEVKNVSTVRGKFCKYHTPFEGILNKIFLVQYENQEIPYEGKLASRIGPSEEDYIHLDPGNHASCSVVLEGYSLKKKGSYKIQFVQSPSSNLPSSNTIEVNIIG